MRLTRRGALLAGLLLSLALLTGCEDKMTAFDAATYVKGVLDETYKGACGADYMSLAGLTVDDVAQAYADGLAQEYARFVYQFDLDDGSLTDETKAAVTDLLKELCAAASYSVQPAVALDETRYAVEVHVRPMDLFPQVRQDELGEYTAAFAEKYAEVSLEGMDEEAYARFRADYENDWAMGIVELCQNKLGLLGYENVQPILVLVSPDEDGLYGMEDNDYANVCALVLPY